jgi:glutamate/tyrosine decarboxylase-like PLP-dependent enzyme
MREMRDAREEWERSLAPVEPERLAEPGVSGEWSVKDIVAHVTWFEREMLGVLRARALRGSELWNRPQDERNAVIFEENRQRRADDVLAESRRVYADLLSLLEGLADEDLVDAGSFRAMPADWVPWQVLAGNTFDHYRHHAAAIRAWHGDERAVGPGQEETLDPGDWSEMRALGHRMIDDAMTYLETVRDRPVWQPVPAEVKARLRAPLPVEPEAPEQVYQEFLETIFPYPMGNIHPRFWGWVMGNGTPFGVLADMLAATMNPNLGGGNHVANYVEAQVLAWCKEMLGYPADAGGLLVSGGSVANLVGLTVARNTRAEFDIRRQGLCASPRPMRLYGSCEMHSSLPKAVDVLGLGSDALRQIPVTPDFQIDIPALEAAIQQDRAAGYYPFCVIGNAGTVNTGAIDDLARLAEIARREQMWFHVDGAFGALAALAPGLRPLVAGMELADSIAFDLHKWLYMPFEAGCALVRDAGAHRRAFSATPEYLAHHGERGLASGDLWFGDYGIQLSRGFRALKVWMSLKEHGIARYGRLVEQNVEQARYLAGRVDAAPELERLAPVPLNIVCFRFKAAGLDEPALNRLNEELLIRLHESGVAVPSYTTLNDRYALRVAITNHRSRREDFDLLVREVIRLGQQTLEETRA